MKFKYCRIQGKTFAANTKEPKGVFSLGWDMIKNDKLEDEDLDLYKYVESWIAEVLPFPPQCLRRENVVCWFKVDQDNEAQKLVGPMLWLLEKYGHEYEVVYTNHPGKIVFEDEYQVVVEAGHDIVFEEMAKDHQFKDKLEELEAKEAQNNKEK